MKIFPNAQPEGISGPRTNERDITFHE